MFKKSHTQRSDRMWEKTKEIDMEMDNYRSHHSGRRKRRVRSDYDDYPQSRDSQSHRDNERGSSTSKEKGRVKGQDRDHEQWERSKERDREVYQERHHTRKRLSGDYHYRGSRNPDFDRRRDYERRPLLHMIQASETLDAAAPVTVSNLPNDLLTKIFSYLPPPEYINTSLVTRQWKNLWKTHPAIHLEASDFQNYENFKKFIVGFLQSLEASGLKKFSLVGLSNVEESLGGWIKDAVSSRVRELCLEHFSPFTPPTCLFSSSTLVSLSLAQPQLVEEDLNFRLPSLKKLKIVRPSPPTSNKAVELLIKSARHLQEFEIKLCKPTEGNLLSHVLIVSKSITVLKLYFSLGVSGDEQRQSVEIDSPKLTFFKVTGHKSGRFRLTQKPPSLKVYMDIHHSNNLLSEITCCQELVMTSKCFPDVMLYLGNREAPPFTNVSRLKLLRFGICDIPVLQITSRAPNLELITLDSAGAEVTIKIVDKQALLSAISGFKGQ